MAALDIADRRHGSYSRHMLNVLIELGNIELAVPHTGVCPERCAGRNQLGIPHRYEEFPDNHTSVGLPDGWKSAFLTRDFSAIDT